MKKNIENIDKSNLKEVIRDFPKQLVDGLKLADNAKIKNDFKFLEVSGMGGSSLPADLLKIYLAELHLKSPGKNKKLGLFQNRFYDLPLEAHKNTLNIFASYSGNTEETLSSLTDAIQRNLPGVCLATGGKLKSICEKNKLAIITLPVGLQPRSATGYFFSAMTQILVNAGLIGDQTKNMEKLAGKLGKEMDGLEKKGKAIAQKIAGKIPLIYAPQKFKALAMIWKIKINENAKTHAFWNYYPELNHNEMSGFGIKKADFFVISLLHKKDHPQNKKRIYATSELLKNKGVENIIVEMPDRDILHTIFSTLLLGDWVSYYLAMEYGQDPTPVKMVEDFKRMLE